MVTRNIEINFNVSSSYSIPNNSNKRCQYVYELFRNGVDISIFAAVYLTRRVVFLIGRLGNLLEMELMQSSHA